MEVNAIAELINNYGWPGAIAVLLIVFFAALFFSVRKGCIAVWQHVKPLMAKSVDRHVAFLDSTTENMRKQAEAMALLAERIEKMSLGDKLDTIHDGVQVLINRGCGRDGNRN